MAATRIIEEDRGVCAGHVHAHNGYYAGDFGRRGGHVPVVPNTSPVAPTPARPFLDRPPRWSHPR
jgi:hypothetical protein